jgi:hypothetical protein
VKELKEGGESFCIVKCCPILSPRDSGSKSQQGVPLQWWCALGPSAPDSDVGCGCSGAGMIVMEKSYEVHTYHTIPAQLSSAS